MKSEPLACGGTNEGPSPTATAYSAQIGCTNVIGNKCAAKLGVDFGTLSFEMKVDFDRRGGSAAEEELAARSLSLPIGSL